METMLNKIVKIVSLYGGDITDVRYLTDDHADICVDGTELEFYVDDGKIVARECHVDAGGDRYFTELG